MVDWLWMPFGLLNGVGQGMSVLHGGLHNHKGKGSIGVFLPIVFNGVLSVFLNRNVFDSCLKSL